MPLEAPYVNASLPVDERVDDLVSRMNLDEKLAQIGSVWLTDLVQRRPLRRGSRGRPASTRNRARDPDRRLHGPAARGQRQAHERDPARRRRTERGWAFR